MTNEQNDSSVPYEESQEQRKKRLAKYFLFGTIGLAILLLFTRKKEVIKEIEKTPRERNDKPIIINLNTGDLTNGKSGKQSKSGNKSTTKIKSGSTEEEGKTEIDGNDDEENESDNLGE